MDYIEEIEAKTGHQLPGRGFFRNLNNARSSLKHLGVRPNHGQWATVISRTFDYLSKLCEQHLHVSFEKLDTADFILDEGVRSLYGDAVAALEKRDYKCALELLAFALHAVFKSNRAMFGLEVGHARTEDAIKLSSFGVPASEFFALQEFLPEFDENVYGDKSPIVWRQAEHGHPANWTHTNVEFCLRVFLDTVIKIQSAVWIPTAFDLSTFYAIEIEAIEDVKAWYVDFRYAIDAPITFEPSAKVAFEVKAGHKIRVETVAQGDPSQDCVFSAMAKAGDRLHEIVCIYGWGKSKATPAYLDRSKVKLMCVPRDDEQLTALRPDLKPLEWLPTSNQ